MKTEIFTLCDNAQTYGSKVVIVGTFNEIGAESYPVKVPNISLVIRIAFEPDERLGGTEILITGYNKQDPELKIAGFRFVLPSDDNVDAVKRHFTNITLNLDGLVLPKAGTYVFSLNIGDWNDDFELYANSRIG